MKWLGEAVRRGEFLAGTFLNLGSSLTAEIAGKAGFDWVLIDLEHGAGDQESLLLQLQAIEGTPAVPIVRIAWNDPVRTKRVLDLGPSGVMIPYVNSVEEATRAVSAMRYPPLGVRGVASMNRACGFGASFEEYFKAANANLLVAVQIETKQAVERADEIAAVEGVDVLFVGPLDLSVSLGVVGELGHPLMRDALAKVVSGCGKEGKSAGLMLSKEDQIKDAAAAGFTFIGLSSDGGLVARGMRELAAALKKHKPVQ